jgi:putative spermidine/putrescine transport system permease protein
MTSWLRRNYLVPALFAPALVVICVLLVVPLAGMFYNSVNQYDVFKGSIAGFTLEHYRRFVSDPFFSLILLRTIRISALTTLACLLIGYPIAYYFVFYARLMRTPILIGLLSPLFVSALVRTYGWLILLGRGGTLDLTLQNLGLSTRPTTILQTEAAVVLGMTHLFLAFMVLAIVAALQNIDRTLFRAAQISGAPPSQVFWRVTWPLSVPGVLAGSVLVFSLSAGAFITPAIMGGLRVRVMSFAIWEQVSVLHNYAFGSVLAVVLLTVVAALVFIGTKLSARKW